MRIKFVLVETTIEVSIVEVSNRLEPAKIAIGLCPCEDSN